MQAPTHFIAGILIEKSTRRIKPTWLRHVLVASGGIISHGILDKLARATYHPPDPLFRDWFWVIYHLSMLFIAIYILRKYWKEYKFGIIFAVLPDFDWLLSYSFKVLGFSELFWEKPILHETVYGFLNLFPPFRVLNAIPNWTLERKGAILEVGPLTGILVTILWYRSKFRNSSVVHVTRDQS